MSPFPENTVLVLPSSEPSSTVVVSLFHLSSSDGIKSPLTALPASQKVTAPLPSPGLVQEITRPVILAGGLTPENVADAIRTVRPWGVDSHTGVENVDGGFSKEKASAFIKEAHQVRTRI